MKKVTNNRAYKLLAIAVIRRAIIDEDYDYLKSEDCRFYLDLSGTELPDYYEIMKDVMRKSARNKLKKY